MCPCSFMCLRVCLKRGMRRFGCILSKSDRWLVPSLEVWVVCWCWLPVLFWSSITDWENLLIYSILLCILCDNKVALVIRLYATFAHCVGNDLWSIKLTVNFVLCFLQSLRELPEGASSDFSFVRMLFRQFSKEIKRCMPSPTAIMDSAADFIRDPN